MSFMSRRGDLRKPLLRKKNENAMLIQVQQVALLQVQVLSTQLDSVSTQATLVIGFSLGMWAGETLVPLTADDSPHCIYKTWWSQLLGACFFMVTALGASFCCIVVGLSCYVKSRSLHEAVRGDHEKAIELTEDFVSQIYANFIGSGVCFVTAIITSFWLFVGVPNAIPWELDAADEHDETAMHMHNGEWRITCIDRYSADAQDQRDLYCYLLAWAVTAVILGMSAWGVRQFWQMKSLYDAPLEDEHRTAEGAPRLPEPSFVPPSQPPAVQPASGGGYEGFFRQGSRGSWEPEK